MDAAFFLLFLFVLVIAVLIGLEVRGWHRERSERVRKASEMLAAVADYLSWLDHEVSATLSNGTHTEPHALIRMRQIKHAYFPELTVDLVEVLIVHAELVAYLWRLESLKRLGGIVATGNPAPMRDRLQAALDRVVAHCSAIARVGAGTPPGASGQATGEERRSRAPEYREPPRFAPVSVGAGA